MFHLYHRYRVTEADRTLFRKLVGSGTLMLGVSMILFGILYYIFEQRLAIVDANQAMVDRCDVLIAHAKYPENARNLMEYAKRKGVLVINLAEKIKRSPYNEAVS